VRLFDAILDNRLTRWVGGLTTLWGVLQAALALVEGDVLASASAVIPIFGVVLLALIYVNDRQKRSRAERAPGHGKLTAVETKIEQAQKTMREAEVECREAKEEIAHSKSRQRR